MEKVTRGVRNNNPGNIDYNPANKWVGQLGIEQGKNPRFALFDTPENGIRALGKLLQTYRTKYGLKTVGGIISRWAPGVENDTAAYVRAVEGAFDILRTAGGKYVLASSYADLRRSEYPPIGDQLDALFHAGVFPPEMAAMLQAVKDKYPKPKVFE